MKVFFVRQRAAVSFGSEPKDLLKVSGDFTQMTFTI